MDMHPRLAAVRFQAVPNLNEPELTAPEIFVQMVRAGMERTDA